LLALLIKASQIEMSLQLMGASASYKMHLVKEHAPGQTTAQDGLSPLRSPTAL